MKVQAIGKDVGQEGYEVRVLEKINHIHADLLLLLPQALHQLPSLLRVNLTR